MKKHAKVVAVIGAAVVAVAVFLTAVLKTAGGPDVVGTGSVSSFEAVLNAAPGRVSADEANAGWSLEAPDGSVRFVWSEDDGRSPLHDVMLEFDARPFVKAGLDTARLPENYAAENGRLTVGTDLGGDRPSYEGKTTPLSAYERIVGKHRGSVGYHAALDHYNVSLGGGNLFEWARDMKVNRVTDKNQEKDIVFVLNPKPLVAAGADPKKVEGWVYAAVSMEMDGKAADVYKFLKPFNLQ